MILRNMFRAQGNNYRIHFITTKDLTYATENN
jgi:hypothetical protein